MKSLVWFFMLFPFCLWSQYMLKGVVIDANSQKNIPFATIKIDSNIIFSDANGNFLTELSVAPKKISISKTGFHSTNIHISQESEFHKILLSQKEDASSNIQDNFAYANGLAVIQNSIINRKMNDPLQKLEHLNFKSYQKVIVSANPDSISSNIDTIIVRRKKNQNIIKIDSSQFKLKKFLEKQHLFITEKVTNIQFENQKIKKTVLGTQMSGLKTPVYEIVGYPLSSASVYESNYRVMEQVFPGFVSKKSIKNYRFNWIDSISFQGRSSHVLHFKYLKKSNFEGLIYIDKQTFAVTKLVYKWLDVIEIQGSLDFQYLDKIALWLPKTTNIYIKKGNNDSDVKLLNGVVQFKADSDEFGNKRSKTASDFFFLWAQTSFFDFNHTEKTKIENPAISLKIPKEAIQQDSLYWSNFRLKSNENYTETHPVFKNEIREQRATYQNNRNKQTFVVLDSILLKQKIEKRILFGRKMVNGYVPVSVFDFDLRHLISFNNYEGFRLGLGGMTNDNLSKHFKLEGYSAYGLKDQKHKYQAGSMIKLHHDSESWLGLSFTNDIREIASTSFLTDKRGFKLVDPRPFNVTTFYHYKTWRTYFETKLMPKAWSVWQLSQSEIVPLSNYQFLNNGRSFTRFEMTTAQVSVQWNPWSLFMQTPDGRQEIEKSYPKFTFQTTHSLNTFGANDFDFWKFDFRTEYEKKYLNQHKFSALFQAGFTEGDVPLTHLYSISPNNLTKDAILQRVTLAGKNSFETMYFNEFFSSTYAMMQFKYAINRQQIARKIKPSFVLVTRMAWGNMKDFDKHQGIEFKTLEKGYIESGVEINKIYKGFGITSFYRYGPNQLPKFDDNISLKISYFLDLGL
jgi:hypothetical protein